MLRKLNPVDRVWVLNPTHHEGNIIDKEEEGIKLIQLIPGKKSSENHSELKEEISEAFDGEINMKKIDEGKRMSKKNPKKRNKMIGVALVIIDFVIRNHNS